MLLCHVNCVCVCAHTLLYSDLYVFHYYTRLALFASYIGNKGGEVTGDSRKVHKVDYLKEVIPLCYKEFNFIYCNLTICVPSTQQH